MSSTTIPTHPIQGGRVYRPLSLERLQALAQNHDACRCAHILTDRIREEWSRKLQKRLANIGIHLVGFEILVNADVQNSPFPDVSGAIGVTVFWLTIGKNISAGDPAIYVFLRQGDAEYVGLRSAAGSMPTKGTFYVANHIGDPDSVSPESWCIATHLLPAGSSALLTGEFVANAVGAEQFFVSVEGGWIGFGTDLSLARTGRRLTVHYQNGRYRHFEWLLTTLGLRARTAGTPTSTPKHEFANYGNFRIPNWAPDPTQRIEGEFNVIPLKSRKLLVRKNSPNPTSPYETADTAAWSINDALVEAKRGDVVVVIDDAVYEEVVFPPDGVSLTSSAILGESGRISEQPADFPTIGDPNALSPAVVLKDLMGGSTHVSGFRITSGGWGSGVLIDNCYDIELTQNDIHDNRAAAGGGIAVFNSRHISITENVIRDNDATGDSSGDDAYGGGVYTDDLTADVTVKDNAIYRNTASDFGGGVAVIQSGNVVIQDNDIGGLLTRNGNVVTGDRLPYLDSVVLDNPQGGGGGIGVFDAHVRIHNNDIQSNEAHVGGGIEFYAGGSGNVADNDIVDNRTRPEIEYNPPLGGDGGGVAVNNTALTAATADTHRVVHFHDNYIANNVAEDDGGGVYGTAKALIKITGNNQRITGNQAKNNGGGVRVTFGSQLQIDGGEIRNNQANLKRNSAPAILAEGGGGGVAIRNATAKIENCTIQDNSVIDFGGGGVYVVTVDLVPSLDHILTGAYRFERAEIELSDCTIIDNAATQNRGAGGGFYVVYDEYDVYVHVTNTTLSPNTAQHSDTEKAHNVVFQDVSAVAIDRIDNDTDLPSLTPLANYEETFEP